MAAVDAGAGAPSLAGPEREEDDLAATSDLVRRAGADVGFAQNEGADRLAVVDESGTPLGADASVVLAVQRWLERRPGPVVVSVATSRTVEDVTARAGCPVHRSRVGEANVLEAMTEHGAEVGGEGDGGLIVLPVNACLDSFAAMAVILETMAVSGSPVSALRARVPRYAMIRERLLCQAREIAPSLRLIKTLFRGERFDLTDGVKVTWPDRWVIARPSTSEAVIRLVAEAPAAAGARTCWRSWGGSGDCVRTLCVHFDPMW